MSDRLTITGKDGKPRFLVVGDQVSDLRDHKHQWVKRKGKRICKICKSLKESQ